MAADFGAAASQTSTVLLSGFAANANDRELENFCRFLPGFVAAKASLKGGAPKVWARFDNAENALAAAHLLEGVPFDPQEPEVLLKTSLARTDMHPPSVLAPRKGGVQCVAGSLDALLGLQGAAGGAAGSHWAQADSAAAAAAVLALDGWKQPADFSGGSLGASATAAALALAAPAPAIAPVLTSAPATAAPRLSGPRLSGPSAFSVPPLKRPRADAVPFAAPLAHGSAGAQDTLCVRGVGEAAGVSGEVLTQFFQELQGFVAIRLAAGGRGVAFVKFQSDQLALEAMTAALSFGLQAELARTSLNLNAPDPATKKWCAMGSDGLGENDTLCVTNCQEKGLRESDLVQFFSQFQSFCALRYATSGRGGGTCFVKFSSPAEAQVAMHVAREKGVEIEVARTSLNPNQATHVQGLR
eukprot:TRINITY_DN15009_c0_g1_i1.p1 TRINITY_DN15009_c0_g1~~TRINITY_DN15009_c0_g1_i1.p1  ORF type:complete len:436 (-),score=89.77 TRINITY_DN15009_c0_g1_i1:62-1303(-)